jgi:hypothetical protein
MTNIPGRLLVASTLALTLCTPAGASAETAASQVSIPADRPPLREAIRRSLNALVQEQPAPAKPIRAQGSYGRIKRVPHARLKRDIGLFVGVVSGMIAGGYVGAKIEGDSCRCDDPGLQGFIIGAPIGAVLGGLAGPAIGSR